MAAQQPAKQYTAEWKKIDSLMDKADLPQSALKLVNDIYTGAKRENNDAQMIRALVYRMAISDRLTDEGKYENLRLLEEEIRTAKEPARSILSSIAGGSYWHYLQLNRWQFYDRTRVRQGNSDDIATWDLATLYNRITQHYMNSVANEALLQKTRLEPFDAIIDKGNVRHLRPTMYDLLAHRALAYLQNDERYITRPAYRFSITDDAAFADAATFAEHKFSTRDTASLHYKALLLYQQLVRFHLNDKDRAALADADIHRLQFMNNFGEHINKEVLFEEALIAAVARYKDVPVVADAMYLLANLYWSKGSRYMPGQDTTNRYALKQAKQWCERAIDTRGQTEGKSNAATLLSTIVAAHISPTVEKVNLPNEPFRAMIAYKNSSSVWLRLVRVDDASRRSFQQHQWNDSAWKNLLARQVVSEFNYKLPLPDDHQFHRTEVKVDALPLGEYALIASDSKNFALEKGTLGVSFFFVSSIAYVHNENSYVVVNRKTGSPLAKATIEIFRDDYDYRTQRNVLRSDGKYNADAKGYVQIRHPKNEQQRSYRLDVRHNDDRLFLDDQSYYSFRYDAAQPAQQTYLFTDRSIYRPGQIVYFKGVRIQRNKNNKPAVVAGAKSKVQLFNANGELVDSIEVTTNEFGSYNGRFTLPSGVLNGQFRVHDEATSSDVSINVEEYKRPKFYVEVAPPKGTYKLGDSVLVGVNANSYSGAAVNGATVSYRVVRRANIPLPWGGSEYVRIWPPYPQQELEIAHGTVTLDAEGKAKIPFVAIPDASIKPELQPVFHYAVYADVTDLTGETRSAQNSIAVGYQALKLRIAVAETLPADSLRRLQVFSTNMADSFEQSSLRISIFKLDEPTRQFRTRFWETPDQFVMRQEDYYKSFPFDQYSDEMDVTKWKKLKAVLEHSAASTKDGYIQMPSVKFQPGWHVIEVHSKDKYGNDVTDKKYIQLTSENLSGAALASVLVVSDDVLDRGEIANYKLLTNINSPYIISAIVTKSDTVVNVSNELFGGTLKPEAAAGAWYAIKTAIIKENRVYVDSRSIAIAGADTTIKIEYTTFRDKLLPGAQEKWSVKISGARGEKVAAELLTSMYDASLDQFAPHSWNGFFTNIDRPYASPWNADNNFSQSVAFQKNMPIKTGEEYVKKYDQLRSVDGSMSEPTRLRIRGVNSMAGALPKAMDASREVEAAESAAPPPPVANGQLKEQAYDASQQQGNTPAIQPRTNLNETAFFFPDLKTDSSGSVTFSFTAPEALTTWKWMLFAHTRSLANAVSYKDIVTQKELMVQPNLPRFVRAGDKLSVNTKIANLSAGELNGTAMLELIDALTGKRIDADFGLKNNNKTFRLPAGQSTALSFDVTVPANFTSPVTYRILASAKNNQSSFGDGEENTLPVLSNRMLVTESIVLPYRGTGAKKFEFSKLLNSGSSKSLTHHALTVEFTSNPAWYAVQALPYLTETKDENAEQVFNRFYANALASQLAQSAPRIKEVIQQWNTKDTSAFLSNLQKNEELKSVMLAETPWVLAAKTEAQQKRNVALLFDVMHMSADLQSSIGKLRQLQVESGGFVWYMGAPEDRYMTQYIVAGLGKLRKLNAVPKEQQQVVDDITRRALRFLDAQIKREYDQVRKLKNKLPGSSTGNLQAHYLYMRSFFTSRVTGDVFPAYNYFRNEARKNWMKQNSYTKAMLAVAFNRTADKQTAAQIMASLKENAIRNDEFGTYWKDMSGGYYWYQAPVETQSVLIEAFIENGNDTSWVNDLRTWLLKNKQTNKWKTTKATADACYALLLGGSDWLSDDPKVNIMLGNKSIQQQSTQAGTGYFKSVIPASEIKPALGQIEVSVVSKNAARPSWGAVYWQYFEDLDKITTAETGLKIRKQLMIQRNTDAGPVLDTLRENNALKVGDKIKVRIEIRSDRQLEYVHMKDMRAASFEPTAVLSGYQWQGGLGYYQSAKDASMNFYFGILPKGVHVFEYEMFATQAGTFSNGITTIQCMYAPEFASHSEGINVNVKGL